jgi:hypothetical protein
MNWTLRGITIDWSDDLENAPDSIRVKCEFDSNVIDESEWLKWISLNLPRRDGDCPHDFLTDEVSWIRLLNKMHAIRPTRSIVLDFSIPFHRSHSDSNSCEWALKLSFQCIWLWPDLKTSKTGLRFQYNLWSPGKGVFPVLCSNHWCHATCDIWYELVLGITGREPLIQYHGILWSEYSPLHDAESISSKDSSMSVWTGSVRQFRTKGQPKILRRVCSDLEKMTEGQRR